MSVEVQITRYEASALPLDHHERSTFAVAVEWTGTPGTDRQWAVRRLSSCLSVDGEWVYEPMPSSRDDEFYTRHRFTLDEALDRARDEAGKIVVNGWTPQAVLERQP